jgi:hypothetical protein
MTYATFMSYRGPLIVAWHEVPGTAPPEKDRPVGYGVIRACVRSSGMRCARSFRTLRDSSFEGCVSRHFVPGCDRRSLPPPQGPMADTAGANTVSTQTGLILAPFSYKSHRSYMSYSYKSPQVVQVPTELEPIHQNQFNNHDQPSTINYKP